MHMAINASPAVSEMAGALKLLPEADTLLDDEA
jgi:hypothetical protein